MANQLKMALIDTIFTLRQRGWSQRRIAAELDIDRATVARYLQQAAAESKPAIAPLGSDAFVAESKPAIAPLGSDAFVAESKPAIAPDRYDQPPRSPEPSTCGCRVAGPLDRPLAKQLRASSRGCNLGTPLEALKLEVFRLGASNPLQDLLFSLQS